MFKIRKVKVLLLVLTFIVVAVLAIRYLERSGTFDRLGGCQKVFTMSDPWEQDRPGIYVDDDFAWNVCEDNHWNCNDFCTQQDAQKILENCAWSDSPDINKLDADKNGIACEFLL